MITKNQLFTKYGIGKGHEQWNNIIDNWYSVEIYRRTHDEQLPPRDDISAAWVCDFIDKTEDAEYYYSLNNPGCYFHTAKRMVYRYADAIVEELNAREEN
jgi:hypothetical protein